MESILVRAAFTLAPWRRPDRGDRGLEAASRLPSGALRVAVYAGLDPITGRRHYLREVVPAGPRAEAEADRVIRRLAGQVDEQCHPRTSATLDYR